AWPAVAAGWLQADAANATVSTASARTATLISGAGREPRQVDRRERAHRRGVPERGVGGDGVVVARVARRELHHHVVVLVGQVVTVDHVLALAGRLGGELHQRGDRLTLAGVEHVLRP